MLKYSTVVGSEEAGKLSPTHHKDTIELMRNNVHLTSQAGAKMAVKRRGGKRSFPRDGRGQDPPHLPPINQSASPQGMTITSHAPPPLNEKRDMYQNPPIRRKEIRTPYISHIGINRATDVATPYILHTQISNFDPNGPLLQREHSKLSGNVVELRREPEMLRHEPTSSSLQKFPPSNSPNMEKRPRGRHGGRAKNDENDVGRVLEQRLIPKLEQSGELQIHSNQIGLYHRTDRQFRDSSKDRGKESFSIRKKIEQFRKWHEEQYREKIKKLKQEVDNQFEVENYRLVRQVGPLRDTPTDKSGMSVNGEHEKVERAVSEKSLEKMDEEKDHDTTNKVPSTTDTKPRTDSARTWRTWRQVNESYAYTDVKRYIRENELMDPEKELWIKKWILEVNKAMREEKFHESML